jgi:hypothetical protein
MKLRWVEREIYTPMHGINPIMAEVKIVKVLQYWSPINDWSEDGNWVDVPLEVEE